MIYFRACHFEHIKLIQAQDEQVSEKATNINAVPELLEGSIALSAWHNALCVGAGGIRAVWQGRAVAWALLSPYAGPAMSAIVRRLRFGLASHPAKRVEMTVRADFVPACRLATLLGFRLETPDGMEGFYQDGGKAFLFARIKP